MSVRYRKTPSLLAQGSSEPTSHAASQAAQTDTSMYVAERYDQSLRTKVANDANVALTAMMFKGRLCAGLKKKAASSTPALTASAETAVAATTMAAAPSAVSAGAVDGTCNPSTAAAIHAVERSAPTFCGSSCATPARPTSAQPLSKSATESKLRSRPGSAAARLSTVDETSLRSVQSAAALQREQRRATSVAANVAAAVRATRPASAGTQSAAERAAVEAAAIKAAVYKPSTVVSTVPADKRQAARLPLYTGHMLPPADRDGAFTYVDAQPPPPAQSGNPFDSRERQWSLGYWEQQQFPTHSTLPRKEQYDALSDTLSAMLEELRIEQEREKPALPARLVREREVYGMVADELSRQGRTENRRRTELMERVIGRAWDICDELLPLVVRLSQGRVEMQASRDVVLNELASCEETILELRKGMAKHVLDMGIVRKRDVAVHVNDSGIRTSRRWHPATRALRCTSLHVTVM